MTPALALGVGATRIANVVPRGATRDAETAAGGGAARRRRRRPSVAMRASGASASSSSSSFAEPSPSPSSPSDPYPRLAVFDLDACFWNEEMYTLRHLVDASAEQVVGELGDSGLEGVVGARSGADVVIRIHPGAMRALQRFHAGEYPGMRIAAASSADTPLAVRIGRSALDVLEVFPGRDRPAGLRQGLAGGIRGKFANRSNAAAVAATRRGRTFRFYDARRASRTRACCSSTTATGATTAPPSSAGACARTPVSVRWSCERREG